MFQRNWKSLTAGALIFITGQFIAAQMIGRAGDSSGGGALANASWLLIQFSTYIVAGLAGGIAARLAVERPYQAGILAVLVGYTLLLVPAILTSRQSLASAVVAFVMFALFAWLGAIIGARRPVKLGT